MIDLKQVHILCPMFGHNNLGGKITMFIKKICVYEIQTQFMRMVHPAHDWATSHVPRMDSFDTGRFWKPKREDLRDKHGDLIGK